MGHAGRGAGAIDNQPASGIRHPAIAAGQIGFWDRDFPLSYPGLTGFLEDVLVPLRTAKKVS